MGLSLGDIIEYGEVFVRVKDESNEIFSDRILPLPGALKNTPKEGDNLSCDWKELSTAQESLDRIAKQGKDPKTFYLYSFEVDSLNQMKSIEKIEYHPIPDENNSHCQIYKDNKDIVVRERMAAIAKLVLPDLAFNILKLNILIKKERQKIKGYESQTNLRSKAKAKLSQSKSNLEKYEAELASAES